MISDKPMKTFVYLPVYLKDKYVCSAVFKCGPLPISVGDVFVVDKRPATYALQKKLKRYKAVAVEYNLLDPSRMVELEPVAFSNEKEITAFMSGKARL